MHTLSSDMLETPRYSVTLSLSNGETLCLADPKATRAMLALMNMEAVMGGAACHWGGPSAFLEITTALMGCIFHQSKKQSQLWHDLYHIINDAGHCENGLYALKTNYGYAGLTIEDLKKFRSISSVLTGHGEAHLFPKGVYLSNGPLGSTMAQAQGLCLADRLQEKTRTTIVLASDGAFMEGETKEALAAIPGWAKKQYLNPFILIVSDNNTKLSGRIDKDSFSMEPTFNSLTSLGWQMLTLKNPHHLQDTVECISKALQMVSATKPILLRAKTIKGYGNQQTEQSDSGGHGFPLKTPIELKDFLNEIYQNQPLPSELTQWAEEILQKWNKKQSLKSQSQSMPYVKVQEGISQALIHKKEQGLPIVSISADLQGSTGVMGFRKKFPKWAFDVGVAEANMFSVASGLSKQGFVPIVDTFAQFGVSKGALPLFMGALSHAPVLAVLSHIGFQDAADGASHQCLSYLAQTGSIPNTRIYTLSSSEEAKALLEQAIDSFQKQKQNYIFFIGREKYPPTYLPKEYSYQLNKAQIIFSQITQKPKACTLLATGTLLNETLKAAKTLAQNGWDTIVIHASIINQPDVLTIKQCLQKTKGHLLTVEDHQIKGGMGAFVTHALSLNQIPFSIHSLGVKGGFGRSAYQAVDLYQQHGLDTASIVKSVQNFF